MRGFLHPLVELQNYSWTLRFSSEGRWWAETCLSLLQPPSPQKELAKKGSGAALANAARGCLLLLLACLFPAAFARQCFFYALFFAGLQTKGVPLDLPDDVFLLHFALKTPQGVLQRFAFLQSNLSQQTTPPNSSILDWIVMARIEAKVKSIPPDLRAFRRISAKSSAVTPVAPAAEDMNL